MASEGTGCVEDVLVSNCILGTKIMPGNWWGNGEPIAFITSYHHNSATTQPIPQRGLDIAVQRVRINHVIAEGVGPVAFAGVRGNIRDVRLSDITVKHCSDPDLGIKGPRVDNAPGEKLSQYAAPCILYMKDVSEILVEGIQGYIEGQPIANDRLIDYVSVIGQVNASLNGASISTL